MDLISLESERKGNLSAATDAEGGRALRKKVEGRKLLKTKLKNSEKENVELKRVVEEKNQQIDDLQKHISSLNDMINSVNVENLGRGSSVASTKIMELSKKIRQMTAELEAAKSKYSKLNAKFSKLEKELSERTPKSASKESQKKTACCNSASKLESLNEQLGTTKQKLFEALNQTSELKGHLKLAQKCIQQEIGENVNLSTLVASGTSWRGRAQQIMSLQNKVAELKERIEMAALGDEPMKQEFRRLETLKRVEIQDLNQKMDELNAVIEEQKKKIAALKTRNKNLCDDAMNYKIKTLNLMEKSGSSDNSVAILQEKISIQKFQYEAKIMDLRKQIESSEEGVRQAHSEHSQTRMQIQNLELLINDKNNVIAELQNVAKQLEDDLKNVCGGFLFECRDFKKDEYVAILDALEQEKEALLKHISELNQRLEDEREKVNNFTDQLSKQRIKYCRLESKYRDMIKEQEIQQDKKKRNQRANDYARSLNGGISTLIFESSSPCIIDTPGSGDGFELQIEDFKNKLELANERITFLEEKLAATMSEHKSDAKAFNEIINSSKNTILQMILENRKSKCTLNASDSLEDQRYPYEEYQPDSLEETSIGSRIFAQDKNE